MAKNVSKKIAKENVLTLTAYHRVSSQAALRAVSEVVNMKLKLQWKLQEVKVMVSFACQLGPVCREGDTWS